MSRLQLVEVVSHDGTDAELLTEARAFVGAIDRLPLPVKSSPGFLVNRALTPYMLEAMVMLDEKIDKTPDRRGRGEVRHADGPDRARRSGRPRYLPRCR